jgi:dihydrofolate reductase
MGKLIYVTPMSLDGFIADEGGDFGWSVPSEEVHAFFNDLIRPVGTHLYGRKMYETMVYWETPPPESSSVELEFGDLWRDADKVVYSTTLGAVSSARTRLERDFDVEAVRRLKASADGDITIGGPHLAAHAIRAGLVDDYQFLAAPILLGGGNRVFPDGVRIDLELVEQRRFDNGMALLRYRPR